MQAKMPGKKLAQTKTISKVIPTEVESHCQFGITD